MGDDPYIIGETKKFQITNGKFQTNHNYRNSKFQTSFDHLLLEFEICLQFGAWSLGFHRLQIVEY